MKQDEKCGGVEGLVKSHNCDLARTKMGCCFFSHTIIMNGI